MKRGPAKSAAAAGAVALVAIAAAAAAAGAVALVAIAAAAAAAVDAVATAATVTKPRAQRMGLGMDETPRPSHPLTDQRRNQSTPIRSAPFTDILLITIAATATVSFDRPARRKKVS